MNKASKKSGQTLIEVVVSLMILTMILVGTITLIINIVNLSLSSRDKTEAMAFAQKSLTEARVYLTGGCNTINDNPDFSSLGYVKNGSIYSKKLNNRYDVYLQYVKTDDTTLAGIDKSDSGFNTNDFGVLEVRINWTQKGMPNGEIIARQVVRKQ